MVEIYESEIKCIYRTKLNAKIIALVNGPDPNLYYAGTETGFFSVIKVVQNSFEIIESCRLYSTPLSSISIDPFGRALVVASNGDDKVLALSFYGAISVMPKARVEIFFIIQIGNEIFLLFKIRKK
jgi:hypothetical protein